MVGAPYAGVGGYQRGAALVLESEMEAGGVYTVPGNLGWLPGSEGTQVNDPSNLLSHSDIMSPWRCLCPNMNCCFVRNYMGSYRTMRGRLPPSISSTEKTASYLGLD